MGSYSVGDLKRDVKQATEDLHFGTEWRRGQCISRARGKLVQDDATVRHDDRAEACTIPSKSQLSTRTVRRVNNDRLLLKHYSDSIILYITINPIVLILVIKCRVMGFGFGGGFDE